MLLASIAFHGLLLLLPLPARQTPESEVRSQSEKSQVNVNLTELPRSLPQSPTATPARSLPQPPAAKPARSLPASQMPQRSPRLQTSARPLSQPVPVPQSTPAQPVAPLPSNSPANPVAPTPVVAPNSVLEVPFADFPNLAGAQAGCFEQADCRQVEGDFRSSAQLLEQQMTTQGYQVRKRDDLEDTGQKIYELTAQDGTTRYLSVLSPDLNKTAYLLASEPVTLMDLQQVEAARNTLTASLESISVEAAIAQFLYPDSFFTGVAPRPEISSLRFISNVQPEQFINRLTAQLQTSGFVLTSIGSYGGGSMHEVGQKAFTGYINLLPTQDHTGTIVVLWNALPG